MDENMARANVRIVKEKRQNGLRFGLLAGLGFSLVLWGVDSLALLRASADLPWLKLVIGLPLCLLIGMLAGWLSARFDNGLLSSVIWALAGLGFVWVASHVPFDGASRLVGLLLPDMQGREIYPFVEVARLRMSLLYIIVGVLMAIGGAFELFVVESAARASSPVSRWLGLVLASLTIFGAIGLLVDDLINRPLREPVVSIHNLIEFGREAQVRSVTQDEARQRGLRALRPFGDLIYQPYRLILGNYDPETITETAVYIDFNGVWASCFLIGKNPMYCQLSHDLYEQRLACLLDGGAELGCKMKLAEQGHAELQKLQEKVGKQPEIATYVQYGNTILLDVSAAGAGHHLCFLHTTGDIFFERCEPFADGQYRPRVSGTAPSTSAAAAAAIPSPFPTSIKPTVEASGSLIALTPEFREKPPALSKLTHYTIDLAIDYSARSFQGHAQVDYVNTEEVSLGEIYFRLLPNGKNSYGNGLLKVSEVLLNGQPAESELSQQDTVLKIKLPRMLMPASSVQFEFEFYGIVPEDFGGAETPAGYGIYNLSEGVMTLASWYPILAVFDQDGWNLDAVSPLGDSVYSDTALYSIDLTIGEDLVVAATGWQTNRQVSGGRAVLHYESGPVRDFFLVASPDFKVASQTVGETMLNSYYLPGNQVGGELALQVGLDSLRVFSQKFGPYPFTEMDIVNAPMRNAQGVEYPGIMLIADKLYEAPEKPDFAVTVAHEVAHQWWYSVVGNDVFEEPWLDEALATYSSGLYYEFALGQAYQDGLVEYWQGRYEQLLQDGNDDLVTGSLNYFENLSNPRVYGTVVYVKGALFLRALRERIGDEAFFQALRSYYQANLFKIARGADLLDAFERAYRKQLDAFYQVWLYSTQ